MDVDRQIELLTANAVDVISEAGANKSVVVRARDSDDQLTLSGPWPDSSGTRTLSFHYDLYNYAVHFALPVE